MNISQTAINVIIAVAVIAIALIACSTMGVSVPSWVIQVLWVVVIACVCIFAIKFLTGAKQ